MIKFIEHIIRLSLQRKYLILCVTMILTILGLWCSVGVIKNGLLQHPTHSIINHTLLCSLVMSLTICLLNSMILTRVFRIKTKDKIQIEHAIAQGTKSSIRTMLVTTLAIMIGIIIVTNRSIALKQLGIIISSGLVTSILFTLFAFPAIYSIVYNLTRRRKNRKLLEKIGE